ncbi:L,D-transpeptidase [Williamsia sp.]|uniref:L,D-transpeptidase n=1 Tax=Williamsia sp. TaxID=1872085 RepID=UPI0025FD148B|nr:L,D-transpeptidase [Williamsia sp.]
MPTSLRDYWWAILIVPVAVVVTAILVTGLFTGSDPSPGSAVAAAVTSSAPAPGSEAPTSSARTAVEDAVACAGNTGTRLVTVSISEQRMWMCQGTRTVSASPVTTGIDNAADRTPTGTWKVVARETDRFLVGPDYRVHVDYFLPFFDDYGFHDSPWQKFPYGSQDYRTGGSRGCIHVPGPEMAALYRWAAVGTTVTVRA